MDKYSNEFIDFINRRDDFGLENALDRLAPGNLNPFNKAEFNLAMLYREYQLRIEIIIKDSEKILDMEEYPNGGSI